MAKPLKFYQTLNQAPRSIKHGKHRRARAPSHRRSVIGTDHGAGKDDTVTFTISSWNTVWTFEEPKPPAIPYAGIRAGEIIAHRIWWVVELCGQRYLRSLAHDRLWNPGETIHGDINGIVNPWGPIWGGTYAFCSRNDCNMDIALCVAEILTDRGEEQLISSGAGWFIVNRPQNDKRTAVAVGTVKMWGEVVEHERGYRSEYAKLNSIDELYGEGDIDALRARYGVPPAHTSAE